MENILEIQKKAFLKEGPPSLEKRTDLLKRCVSLIETYEEKIIEALNQDFQEIDPLMRLRFRRLTKRYGISFLL